MSHPRPGPSPEPRTYATRPESGGPKLQCSRCARSYDYPHPGDPPIRCECGWWYSNVGGELREEFKPRLGV